MPIKFRCSYCRQFLGISRNRAGEVFDCPTCGRTIRVPGLDGSVAPLPEPELNSADAHLARALDELASLAAGNPVPQPAVAVSDAEAEAQIPQPLPEPEPVELPLPPVVAPVVPAGLATPVIDEPVLASSLADLLPLAASAPQSESSTVAANPLPRGLIALALLSPTLTLLIGLVVGWWWGQSTNSASPAESQPELPGPVVLTESRLTGRVSWRNAEGEIKPDIGAVVIVWPESWDGSVRLSPIGLRPADSEADQAAAAGLVSGMGGRLVRTGADGSYELTVPRPGRYRQLVISRLKSRSEKGPLSGPVLQELQQYLSDPAAAIGERDFSWQPQPLVTGQNPPADQVFDDKKP